MREQGVPLAVGVWGEETAVSAGKDTGEDRREADEEEGEDRFALLWDEKDGVWVAVYRLWVDVGTWFSTFLRLLPFLSLSFLYVLSPRLDSAPLYRSRPIICLSSFRAPS